VKKTGKVLLIFYLAILLILSFLPLTGYYAALGALPVLAIYLYRKIILEEESQGRIVTRGIFLFAGVVFLFGFVLNMFCTLYTTYRMAEFRSAIEEQKKNFYKEEASTPEKKGVPSQKQNITPTKK